MSEGTPGRGPDADSRTDTGDGQAPTNGRPAASPVRYGPRNGGQPNGANGRGGPSGRTVSGPSNPQQYRAPQPPRGPANGTPSNGTPANGSEGSGPDSSVSNGAGTNGAGTNGAGTNGAGTNGAHATPSSYTRPRTNGTSARPEPSEQERLVADARIAAAARNASAAKVRGSSAVGGTRSPAPAESKAKPDAADKSESVDETAVIAAVTAADAAVVKPSGPDVTGAMTADASTTEETAAPERRSVFGRLRNRDRGGGKDPETTPVVPEPDAREAEAEATTAITTDVTTEAKTAVAGAKTDTEAVETSVETEPDADPVVPGTTKQDPATQDRPLTWRDRLGLPPKAPKPDPTDPAGSTVVPAAAGAATTALVAGATPTVPPLQGRVAASPFAPSTTSDTVVIPVVDAGDTGAAVPTAGATALPVVAATPVVAPKPKVGAARRTRKARLRLSRVDPWSVMKTALLFSIAAGIILVVATYGVWSVLNASGLFDAVNDMVKSVVSTPGDTTPFRIEEYVNTQKIIGVAALIAVVDVLIFTALATLGSFLYNLAATVLGGLEVTLAED